eukprot:TRINITY_DN7243_c0_g1_i1.p1 TRINITY_DN7243_c0_g1~~TRINITY_DN7243_c0_g1_i1.p1  ORF type:complete len:275 (+),score=36.92 TRINITY_DN7243_c0_g1_i1:151-975(+)
MQGRPSPYDKFIIRISCDGASPSCVLSDRYMGNQNEFQLRELFICRPFPIVVELRHSLHNSYSVHLSESFPSPSPHPLSLFLYKRSKGSMKTGEPPRPEIIISQPSQNSDRDTSTTTIYDEEIQIPDSGSLIRGPPVDDTSIIRGDFLREGQILDRGGTLFLRPKPLLTFKPHQHAVLSRVDNVPTNYCVAWTQSHLAAFEPSDENASVAERSSISCLRERDSHHIYANVNDNQPRYASLIPKPPRGLQEAIYANDVPSQSRIDEFDYSKFQSL